MRARKNTSTSSKRYIHKVIVCQALLSAVIGFSIAALIGDVIVRLTETTALPILITPALLAGLFLLTIVMCVGSSIAAIVQVTRIDPAMAFTR
jgi:putative ABC transport system permease protein